MPSQPKYRIPPSPTGPLHLGTARTAIYNMILSLQSKGKFLLRLEDTDQERSDEKYTQDILEGLDWLGITVDEGPYRQSEHIARHHFVVDELLRLGHAYECYVSGEELQEIKAAQRAAHKPERYDNRHRTLSVSEKQKYQEEGRKPVVRLRLPDNHDIVWEDLVRGTMRVNTDDLGGDLVLMKSSGNVLYNFAVVVDDHDAGITHIVRGEDHLHNTAKQIAIYQALQWDVPEFGHVPLILTPSKEKLSKRKHGDIAGVSMYREQGYLPEAINNYLIAMSWRYPVADGEPEREVFNISEIIDKFNIADVGKSGAVYDLQKLHWFSKEHFKLLTSEEIYQRALPFLEQSDMDLSEYSHEAILQMIDLFSDSLVKLSDLSTLLKVFVKVDNISAESFADYPMSSDILNQLDDLISSVDNICAESVQSILSQLSTQIGIKKGKKLFLPIRLAISGQSSGADLSTVIAILGKQRSLQRIRKSIELLTS